MDKVPITDYENKIANEEARLLFGYLMKKYCNEEITISGLDKVLNSLCFALVRVIIRYVPLKDREYFINNIIVNILKEGIDK